jgi:dethiobiotin synthetase
MAIRLICPHEFPEPASPHLAAAAAGVQLHINDLDAGVERVRGQHDLLVEGAGGLLAPLTYARHTFAELLPRWQLPAVLVTRPDLGTLNHTMLTVRVARSAGITLRAIIINRARPVAEDSLAVRSAPAELRLLSGLPVVESLDALVNVLLAPTFIP